jgi:hypothetical protein
MRKKILLILCILLMYAILSMARTANAQTPVIAVDPASVTVDEPGQSVSVNITVTDAPDVTQWALNVTWNPAVLEIVDPDNDIVEGPFLKNVGSTMFAFKPVTPGCIPEMFSMLMVDKNASGNGVLCTITFNATAPGATEINIDFGIFLQGLNVIWPELTDGTVTVIPEFPMSVLLPLFLTTTAVIIAIAKTFLSRKRRPLHYCS